MIDLYVEMNNEGGLKCSCGSEYLHFERAMVINGNDGYYTTRIMSIVHSGYSKIDHVMEKVPNRLRETSVVLEYSCENCDNTTVVNFLDHKGMVFANQYRKKTIYERHLERSNDEN